MNDLLQQLSQVLEQRKQADPQQSYVARLYNQGLDTILKKVGEEATETVIAAKNGDPKQLIHEVADLWFHVLVLLTHQNLNPNLVLDELERRFGRSGLEEKAQRKQED